MINGHRAIADEMAIEPDVRARSVEWAMEVIVRRDGWQAMEIAVAIARRKLATKYEEELIAAGYVGCRSD
jgi:hypothetical protein